MNLCESNYVITTLVSLNTRLEGMTFDDKGNLYYTTNSNTIWKVPKDGSQQPCVVAELADEEANLRGIVWHNEMLFICDWWKHSIYSYSITDSKYEKLAGNIIGDQNGTFDEASFCYPYGITMDNNGDLYITEDHRIRKLNLKERIITTIAGKNSELDAGHADGPADEARFGVPCGIAMTNEGTIYVSELDNSCIRKIENGIVSTFGKPDQDGHTDGNLTDALFSGSARSLCWRPDGCLMACEEYVIRVIDLKRQVVTSIYPPEKREARHMKIDSDGNMYIADPATLYKVECKWKWRRFLWIGYLKEDASYCFLAELPKEIINEISIKWI